MPIIFTKWTAQVSEKKVKQGANVKFTITAALNNKFEDRYSVSVHRKGVTYDEDPNKGACSWWRVAKVKKGKKLEISLPVAFNEKIGDYIITLRRDMTGESKKFDIKVLTK